jgi:hypothetical protein
MRISLLTKALLVALSLASIGVMSGCSSGDGKPQSIASDQQVSNIVEMRKLFDKAGGNWDSLTAGEKAEYTKLAGDEAKGQTMWKSMATPMGAQPKG